jgi:hypothetical protein
MIAYASMTGTLRNLAALRVAGWRVLISAASMRDPQGFPYALDNGAWAAHQQGRRLDLDAFREALVRFGGGSDWVVAPDIVEGGQDSLHLSLDWLDECSTKAPRVLIAVQDGQRPDFVARYLSPRVGIFVGGSTGWKLATLSTWAHLCREVGTWCHVGRVNSARRVRMCHAVGATSFDGSGPSRFSAHLPVMEAARAQASLPLWDPAMRGAK